MPNTKETILSRRSIRKYNDIPVSSIEIDTILKAAMAAPSAKNAQPWRFVVVKDKKVQQELREKHGAANYNSDIIIVVCADKKVVENDVFYQQDIGACVENILLQAKDLNLGTVWCGVHPKADREEIVKNILKLDDWIPVALIHIGHHDNEIVSKTYYSEEKIRVI